MAGRSVRRIFIGDVQGCREELETLLERTRFDPAADALHPVGDFVNRGPDNVGVLRLCASLAAGGVLGNHDVHLLKVARGMRPPGKRDTIGDVLAADDRDELLAWLGKRPFVLGWEDVIAVHAGLSPTWSDPIARLTGVDPLGEDPAADFAVRVRTCTADGRRSSDDAEAAGERPWFELYRPEENGNRTVVFGHWSVRGLVWERCLRGLDTGCVWGGKLSAWIPEEDRLVQVPARKTYMSPSSSD